ncbi:unnamed protein product, partial [Mesorhabditis spiculigera]
MPFSASTVVLAEPENLVVDRPEVSCGTDAVTVHLHLWPGFGGRLFVLGHSDDEHCQHRPTASQSAEFALPFGACGMRRIRSLHPRGVTYSFTLVVSSHPVFVTGADRAFSVKCFFREDVRNLHNKLEVGGLSTESLEEEFEPPRCTYELKAESGEELQFARVGQPVVHSWTCHPDVPSVFGLLVHSCVVEDGDGERFELVDSSGCTTDPGLLPALEYSPTSLTASVHSRIFKFADRVQVYFRCSVQLCFRHDGGCDGVTPPQCHGHPGPPPIDAHPPEIPHPAPFLLLNHGPKSSESDEISKSVEADHPLLNGNPILKGKPILLGDVDVFLGNATNRTLRPETSTVSADRLLAAKQFAPTTARTTETTRHARALQSELSVDVVVLPFEKTLGPNGTRTEQQLLSPGPQQAVVCLSRVGTVAAGWAIGLLVFIGAGVGHLLGRHLGRRRLNAAAHRHSPSYKAYGE